MSDLEALWKSRGAISHIFLLYTFFFASVSSTAGLFLFLWPLAMIDVFDWYAIIYVHFRLYLKKIMIKQ